MPGLYEKTGAAKDSSDLQKVEYSELAINKPTVIIMAGWPDNDKAPDALSKEIGFLKKTLAGRPEIETMPNVYCWSHKSALSAVFNVIAYNLPFMRRYSEASKELAQAVIMPLVSENNQPLPLDEARRRLRNLNLHSVCAGTVVAQEMLKASVDMMKEIGYTEEGAKALLCDEVFNLAIAPMTAPWNEKNNCKTVMLINRDDMVVRVKDRVLHPLHRLFFRAGRRLRINPISDHSVLITAAARREMVEWFPKKEIIDGVRLPRWRFMFEKKKGFPINFNHEISDYMNYNYEHNQMAGIGPTVLVNAINRKATLKNAMQLLEPLPDAPEFYRARIGNATVRYDEQDKLSAKTAGKNPGLTVLM